MFYDCRVFNQPIVMDTRSVASFSSMFKGCVEFYQVFDMYMDSAKSTKDIFKNCDKLNQDLVHFHYLRDG